MSQELEKLPGGTTPSVKNRIPQLAAVSGWPPDSSDVALQGRNEAVKKLPKAAIDQASQRFLDALKWLSPLMALTFEL
ncbi:hypothetical protein [Granulicella sp. S156]|jgi:hypothetical protein|uniref:hypothetical protein n=1 Tax=Granulicella sp. S156 TaxID=1747224 RepID=UPI00131C16F6|nr:hypothetical protein [Granulicella sp. S156]